MRYKKVFFTIFLFLFTLSLSSCIFKINLNDLSNGFSTNEKKLMNQYFDFILPYCEGHSYKLHDQYEDEFQLEYVVNNINEEDYSNYLKQFDVYKKLGERFDEKTSTEYKTYYHESTKTYMDTCYYTGETLFKPSLTVYMYHRGYVDYYDKYYTNINHSISSVDDTIDMKNATYSTLDDINGYDYMCPSKGHVKILVIPVDFDDKPSTKINFTINNITSALTGLGTTTSLHDYYYESSYGQLNLSFEVVDKWYRAKKNSSYYNDSKTISELVNDALAYYNRKYDYSSFDSNSDGAIDGIILVHTLNSDTNLDLSWPATRNNVQYDASGNRDTYDNVFAYRFFHVNFDQILVNRSLNTYTLIHEFGHMMGLDDYYDTNYTERTFLSPLNGIDVMDSEFSDQNAFSKLLLGWISEGKVINKSKTIELNSFERTGDFAIISNNYDPSYGPFQEFYIIVYNSGLGLNSKAKYFNQKGIIIYHVDGCLYTYDSGITMMNYNNDQAGRYAERFNLIEFANKDYNPFILKDNGEATLDLVDNNNLNLSFTIGMEKVSVNSVNLTITFN